MKKLTILLFIICLLPGCISVPPQVVMSQELILEGLKTARNNQIALIEAYAADQKQQKRTLLQTTALDAVISEQLAGRDALPPGEVKTLIREYADDLMTEFKTVDARKEDLLRVANENFGELQALSQINLEYMKSLVKATEWQSTLLGKYKTKLGKIEQDVKNMLAPD